MAVERQNDVAVRAYLEYFRDLGVYDFYRNGEPDFDRSGDPIEKPRETLLAVEPVRIAEPVAATAEVMPVTAPPSPVVAAAPDASMAKIISLQDILPAPSVRVAPADRAAALQAIRDDIGDCTRCPLAYAGRRTIVFGDGDPSARLMFIGEGPGADEDASGIPFVGKAGQLLNNMIAAMGLRREQVYIANIVKCRPPANRAPEPIEANTCRPFLARQIDVIQPQIIVALGGTAAMYLLGVKQTLASMRGQWRESRGAKVMVTYHPAFLLRDPRQKGEAWKDLQMVMEEMGLKGPTKS